MPLFNDFIEFFEIFSISLMDSQNIYLIILIIENFNLKEYTNELFNNTLEN